MKILYFDLCAIVIYIILIYTMIARRLLRGSVNHYFILTLTICSTCTLCDFFSQVFGTWLPSSERILWFRYLMSFLYQITRNMTPLFYLLFLIAVTDTWHKIQKIPSALKVLILSPSAVVICALLLNFFNHKMFYYDEDMIYRRGSLSILLYISAVIYILFGIIYLAAYRRLFSKEKFIALFALYPIEILAVLVQFFFPNALVEMFFTAVALLLVMIGIHRPEENIDPILGTGNYYAYSNNLRKTLSNDKQVDIVLIKFTNYLSLFSTLGYDEYNLALKTIAGSLLTMIRKEKMSGSVYSIDRGRFALILDRQDKEKIMQLARNIREYFHSDFAGKWLGLTRSACICTFCLPEDIGDFKSILSFGEKFHNILNDTEHVIDVGTLTSQNYFRINSEIDDILADAMIGHKFEVYYQPIYSIHEQKFVSAEALIRLQHEKYGFISPQTMITAAERSGLIHQIGDFVIESVCQLVTSKAFKTLDISYIEINLSVAQCMSSNLAEHILKILDVHHVPHECINLEITESMMDYSGNHLEPTLKALSDAGVAFSLDDYGTGYSNFKRMVSLPMKIVKLDKSFVDGIENPRMRQALQDTIRMLKNLEFEVLIEGVETEEMVKTFTELGCDYIQGWYYSKALPKEEFIAFCREHNGI